MLQRAPNWLRPQAMAGLVPHPCLAPQTSAASQPTIARAHTTPVNTTLSGSAGSLCGHHLSTAWRPRARCASPPSLAELPAGVSVRRAHQAKGMPEPQQRGGSARCRGRLTYATPSQHSSMGIAWQPLVRRDVWAASARGGGGAVAPPGVPITPCFAGSEHAAPASPGF